jgi:SOS response associated peptidase (SRAP)
MGPLEEPRDRRAGGVLHAIIVTNANALTRPIHDPMPVVIEKADIGPWLTGALGTEVLRPAAEKRLRMWPVSRRVNKTGNGDDDPTLVDGGCGLMPEQPYRNHGLSAAELMQKRAAEEAARKEALLVVEWNAERSPLWSPTIRCAIVAGTPWARCLLSRLPDK